MRILSESVEGLLNGRRLSFDFDELDTFVGGRYVVPESQTFPVIDSFGVNSAGDTV